MGAAAPFHVLHRDVTRCHPFRGGSPLFALPVARNTSGACWLGVAVAKESLPERRFFLAAVRVLARLRGASQIHGARLVGGAAGGELDQEGRGW